MRAPMATYLTLDEILTNLKICRTTLRNLRMGDFPKPFNLTKRRILWHAHEVEAWVAARV
jgi:predicted DNA-binding transcriptional regulator AlpA